MAHDHEKDSSAENENARNRPDAARRPPEPNLESSDLKDEKGNQRHAPGSGSAKDAPRKA